MHYEETLAMQLRAAYFTMRRRAQQRLKGTNATVDQFVVMTLLSEKDGVTQQDLVRRAYSDASTIRAMLVLLEERNLVRRESDDHDARARRVFLTKEGITYQKQLQKFIGKPEALDSMLSPHNCDVVKRCLHQLVEAINADMRNDE